MIQSIYLIHFHHHRLKTNLQFCQQIWKQIWCLTATVEKLRFTGLPGWKKIMWNKWRNITDYKEIKRGVCNHAIPWTWLHIQANESSWPRTHTPWQRCTPHTAAPAQASKLGRTFQAVAWEAGEGQGVPHAEVEADSAAECRDSGVVTGLQVVLWDRETEWAGKLGEHSTVIGQNSQKHCSEQNPDRCWLLTLLCDSFSFVFYDKWHQA